MSSMAALLQHIVDGGLPDGRPNNFPHRRKRMAPSVDSAELDGESAELHTKYRRDDDELSIGTSDQAIRYLLQDSFKTGDEILSDGDAEGVADAAKVAAETEEDFLKTLEHDLNNEGEPTGAKVHQNLAKKKIGNDLSPEKLKTPLSKHHKQENCTELTVAKLNPEI